MANANSTARIKNSPSEVITALWLRASDGLTKQQLEDFAQISDCADMMLLQMRELTEGIGCLVALDKEAGSFQSKDHVADLMFGLSNQIDCVRGLLYVGSAAADKLYRLKP